MKKDQKHPSEAEWMEYLYDEMGSAEKGALEAHVKECPPCQGKRDGLRGTQRSLDEWEVVIPAKHEFAAGWQPVAKWAAAAVLLVSTAFATGRMSRPALDVEALQAQIARPIEARVEAQMTAATERALALAEEKLRAQLASRLKEVADKALAEAAANTKQQLEELAVTLAALREEDKSMLAAELEAYETQRMADYLKFREDLERVALFSQSVAQFASYTPEADAESLSEPEN
jgi:hypothetical protein